MKYFGAPELPTKPTKLTGLKDLLRKMTPEELVGPEKRDEIYRRHFLNKYEIANRDFSSLFDDQL